MNRLLLSLLCATAGVAVAAADPVGGTAVLRQRNEKLIATFSPSVARLKVWFKMDKDGEKPSFRTRYLCPNCHEYHTSGVDRYLEGDRPFGAAAFAVAPDAFLVQDQHFVPDWVDRMMVSFGDREYPAREVLRYPGRDAVLVKTDKPVPGVKPLAFSAAIPFADDRNGVYFFSDRDNGLTLCGTKPNATAEVTRYLDLGCDLVKQTGNAIAVNASNEAVTVVFCAQAPLAADTFAPPAAWASEPAEAFLKRRADVEASVRASTVPLFIHLDDEDNRKDGMARRSRRYREDEESTDIDTVGLVLPEGEVIVPLALGASKMSEIDKVDATLPDGNKTALEFVGAFADHALAVFRFPGGKLPAGVAPARLDQKKPMQRYLESVQLVTVDNYSGRSKVSLSYAQMLGFEDGPKGEVLPDISFPRAKGGLSFYVADDGSVGGLSLKKRDDMYDKDLVTANRLATLLADRDFDPQYAIRQGKDRIRIAWIGVETQRMTDDLSREKKVTALLDAARSSGALVTRVVAGTAADRAGLKAGDVLLTVRLAKAHKFSPLSDGSYYEGFDWSGFFGAFEGEFAEQMFEWDGMPWPDVEGGVNETFTKLGIGKEVVVAYARDGQRREAKLTLEQAPVHYRTARRVKLKDLGLKVSDMTFEVRGYLKLDEKAPGVVIVKVQPGNPAAIAGLRPLEIITHVNNEPVTSAKDFAQKVRGKQSLTFSIRRLAATRVVRIDLKAKNKTP